MKHNPVLVRINHNSNPRYSGLDKLINELEKNYVIQTRPRWIPSFSEQNELWFEIFINSPFFDFLKNLILGGLTWDLIKIGAKKINLKKLITTINEIVEDNEGKIVIEDFKLEFDDITVKIIGIEKNFISTLGEIVKSLYKEIPFLQSQGLTEISEINLPLRIIKKSKKTYFSYGPDYSDDKYDFLTYWEIYAGYGCLRYIFDLKNRTVEQNYDGVG